MICCRQNIFCKYLADVSHHHHPLSCCWVLRPAGNCTRCHMRDLLCLGTLGFDLGSCTFSLVFTIYNSELPLLPDSPQLSGETALNILPPVRRLLRGRSSKGFVACCKLSHNCSISDKGWSRHSFDRWHLHGNNGETAKPLKASWKIALGMYQKKIFEEMGVT